MANPLSKRQQEVMDVLADGEPHRATSFHGQAATALCWATGQRGALVKTWLQRGPTPTGNFQRWYQKL